MGILDQIAQPQMIDIAGALDIRQKRLDADEAKRKEIRMGQLIAEATPNLKQGSMLHQMAINDPKNYMLVAKSIGVPLNSGDQMQQFANDVNEIYTYAQDGPQSAYDHAMSVKAQRNKQGIETPQIDKFLDGMREDPQKALTSVFVLHRSINPEKPISEADKLAREKFEYSKNNPEGADGGEASMHIKNLREYKKLKAAGDPEAEEFAQMVNLKSREGKELTSGVTKIIDDLTEENKLANYNVTRYSSLSKKIRNADYASGVKGKSQEAVKSFFGNQDETTALKKELALIRNSEALKQLPAGSASEKDVELVMEPMPDQNADPTFVADWLDAYAKVSSGVAQYTKAKAKFLAEHGSIRNKDTGDTFIDAWEAQSKPVEQKTPTTDTNTQAQETAAQRFARLTGGQ